MEPKVPASSSASKPERVVFVEPSRFTELLISRRKLERIGNAPDRVRDRETQQTFVCRSEARFAKGA